MTFEGEGPFSGEFVDLENVPTLGLTDDQRQSLNDVIQATARNQFENNLAQLNYDGGLFTIYRDVSKIASSSNVSISTLSNGDTNGVVELSKTFFNISTATFSQSIDTQGSRPQGLAWNDDGTKLYEIGLDSDKIYESNLSTPYDISTATFNQSIDTQDDFSRGLAWNDDGTKLYEIGSGSNNIYEYNVGTAYDISTATFSQSINTQDGIPHGLAWKDDGTKLYEMGRGGGNIYESNLSTPYDISTATFNQSINNQDSFPKGLAWNDDGTKLYEIGSGSANIYVYNLGTAYDISTATFSQSFNTQDDVPTGLAWKDDGSKLYEIGDASSNIYESNASGRLSSGSVVLVSKDLSKAENGGFSNPPSSAVVSQSSNILTNTDITYTLRDGNGNTATVTQSDVDTVVDTSNFTSSTVELEVNLSQSTTNDDKTPTSKDVMVHFKE